MRLVETRGTGGREADRILRRLETRGQTAIEGIQPVVARIVADVRHKGDAALRRYAVKLDGLGPRQPIEIPRAEWERAWSGLPAPLRRAMKAAADQIRAFARMQMPKEFLHREAGLMVGQRVRPLNSAGCYVPSGRHPLPSTLLMTAIPAKVAGVGRVVAVSAKPGPEILGAALLAGVDRLYRVGGAQAVAALAYGTRTIQKVDKIAGPGNWYVTAAKKLVAFDCAIDMLAGPTEIVVASDGGDAGAIAGDLVAQAEHDPGALAILVTTRRRLAAAVRKEVEARVRENPVAREAIGKNGWIFLASSREELQEIVNRIAPEHLTIDSREDLSWVQNAGSIFVGPWSPQPMGDYVSGPNHTLPTGAMARVRGGLSVMDFLKVLTVQEYTPAGLSRLGPAGVALARAEGLTGHAAAIEERLPGSQEKKAQKKRFSGGSGKKASHG